MDHRSAKRPHSSSPTGSSTWVSSANLVQTHIAYVAATIPTSELSVIADDAGCYRAPDRPQQHPRVCWIGNRLRTTGALPGTDVVERRLERATIGLRVEPAATGITFRLAVDYQSVPRYVYRNIEEFAIAMEQYVRDALQEGLYGWAVNDCVITMTSSSYSVAPRGAHWPGACSPCSRRYDRSGTKSRRRRRSRTVIVVDKTSANLT